MSHHLVGKSWSFVNSIFFQNARLLIVTQEKAKLDAKMKQTDSRMVDGMSEEMTEYEFKKMEKEKQVTELRERLAKIKEKVCLKSLCCCSSIYLFLSSNLLLWLLCKNEGQACCCSSLPPNILDNWSELDLLHQPFLVSQAHFQCYQGRQHQI